MHVPGVALIGLDKDEYVVHSDGQHKEGNDLEDDEGGRHPSKAKGSCHRNFIIKLRSSHGPNIYITKYKDTKP